MTGPEPAATPEQLEALAAELGITDDALTADQQEDLNSAVHDAKAEEAAGINNAGVLAQLRYLCEGLTLADARETMDEFAPKDPA